MVLTLHISSYSSSISCHLAIYLHPYHGKLIHKDLFNVLSLPHVEDHVSQQNPFLLVNCYNFLRKIVSSPAYVIQSFLSPSLGATRGHKTKFILVLNQYRKDMDMCLFERYFCESGNYAGIWNLSGDSSYRFNSRYARETFWDFFLIFWFFLLMPIFCRSNFYY